MTTIKYCQNCERKFEAFGGEYEWTRYYCCLGCSWDYSSNDD
jgi:hypothetical protein